MGRCPRFVCVAGVVILLAACTGDGGEGSTARPSPGPWRGGTLRLAMVGDLGWGYQQLDPQRAYWGDDWEVFRCCLLRTLFAHNGRPASEAGDLPQPDLAAALPEVSGDGLTWTIDVKPGIHYAPPLEDVEIVAGDFVRAFLRTGDPDVEAGYPFYFSVIEGFDAYAAGEADTISGLETPDDHTLVIHLTEPTGDFLSRLTLGATAPVPPNPSRPDAVLGAAEGRDGSYGRFLVASGPYMIEGSDDLDLTLPGRKQEPIAGYSPPELDADGNVLSPGSLMLVRNPSWDAATDGLRAAYPDRIEIQLRGETAGREYRAATRELSAAVENGTVDAVLDMAYPAAQLRRYLADPEMKGRVLKLPSGSLSYLVMRLAVPPFDDIHVRRAVAFAIDEPALVRTVSEDPVTGRGLVGAVAATHIVPDGLEHYLLAAYDPYPPSLERAKQEMSLSPYDRNHDGLCDVSACGGVLAVTNEPSVGPAGGDQVAASLRAIGIDLRVELANSGEPWESSWQVRCSDVLQQVPVCLGWGWMVDYPNASTFLEVLFDSSQVETGGNPSLLGASSSQLRQWGYGVTNVPSADDRIDRCHSLTGSSQIECWAELDQYLMEEVLPVIPYLSLEPTFVVSERVATLSYSDVPPFDLSLDRISLLPGSE